MIAVTNRIYVNSNFYEAFEERFHTRAGLGDTMPGFLLNQLLRPAREGDPYMVLTYWERHEGFRAWTQSASFKEHARSGTLPKAVFDKPNRLDVYQVVLDSREPNLEVRAPLRLEAAHIGKRSLL